MTQEPIRPTWLAVAAAGVGALLGVLGARVVLVGSGLSLIPWAAGGLVLGWLCRSRTVAAVVGALFGFALAFTFMTTGYDGAAPLHTRLLPFALLGILGALCGTALTITAHLVRSSAGPARG